MRERERGGECKASHTTHTNVRGLAMKGEVREEIRDE